MKKFVYKYLDSFFLVKRINTKGKKISLFEFDSIVTKENDLFIYGDRLIKELIEVTYVDAVTLKKWVNEWALIKDPKIRLKYYWTQEEPWLPQIKQVTTRLMANDIVSVQPMDGPTGTLMYLDYQYSGDSRSNKNGRTYGDSFKASVAQLIENQRNFRFGELNHPEPPIFISSRAPNKTDKKDLENPK